MQVVARVVCASYYIILYVFNFHHVQELPWSSLFLVDAPVALVIHCTIFLQMQASSTSRFDGVIVLHKAARAGLRLLECIKSLGLIKRWPEEQWDTDIVGHMNVIQGIRDAMAMSVLEFSEYWHEETSDLRCIFFTRVHKLHMASEDEKVIRDIKTLINCRRIYTQVYFTDLGLSAGFDPGSPWNLLFQTLSNSMNIDMKKKKELKSVGNTELTRSSLVRESSLFGQEGSPSCRAHTFSAMVGRPMSFFTPDSLKSVACTIEQNIGCYRMCHVSFCLLVV